MIEQKLDEVLKTVLQTNLTHVDENMKFKDMEIWDSMTFMMLIVKIEETFDISFSDEEIIELDCIRKARELIIKKSPK